MPSSLQFQDKFMMSMLDDKYGTCPYNEHHRILLYRMPAHLVKCRRTYVGPPLDQCIYNATHLVRQGTMAEHLEKCIDFYRFHSNTFNKMAEKLKQRPVDKN